MKYRITNPEAGMFVPAVSKSWRGWRWTNLDGDGRELPPGSRWSGPLGAATHAVATHGQIKGVKVEPFPPLVEKALSMIEGRRPPEQEDGGLSYDLASLLEKEGANVVLPALASALEDTGDLWLSERITKLAEEDGKRIALG